VKVALVAIGGTRDTADPPAARSPAMTVLRFDNVSKQYSGGHAALAGVSFAVEAGEMLFVTGHSGAGKSTLLRLIQLVERPSRGAVLFDERNLVKVRGGGIARHRRALGVVYQDHQLLMDRSVAENVALPLVLRGMKRAEIGKRVRVLLERLGLGPRERALPSQLSAGEQQRVGIARAVIAEPTLLIADEPTGNLDPTLSAEIMALFASLPERGTSVLVASHDLGLVRRMRKRVLVLDHGQLVDDIAPEDLADE
jgi:cell division transport system ATP-binding protein